MVRKMLVGLVAALAVTAFAPVALAEADPLAAVKQALTTLKVDFKQAKKTLLADIATVKADIEAFPGASDKAAAKAKLRADLQQLRADRRAAHEQLKADRLALREAMQAAREAKAGSQGHREALRKQLQECKQEFEEGRAELREAMEELREMLQELKASFGSRDSAPA